MASIATFGTVVNFFFFFFFFIKINFITSKQTITITRTVQLLMYNTTSDEAMDYKKELQKGWSQTDLNYNNYMYITLK